MSAELTGSLSLFWLIFSLSFLVALTGAMAPGPLLTYTIIKSGQSPKQGYLVGLWVIIGHALVEMIIIVGLLCGFSHILQKPFVIRLIGVAGGTILIWFGISILKDLSRGMVAVDFFEKDISPEKNLLPEKDFSSGAADTYNPGLSNPVIGGITVSMSNPYWWIWWATIGLAFMTRFDISFENPIKLMAFFVGHEAGDLIWYLAVSFLTFFGLKRLNKKIYYGILTFCSGFMILFGLYLGISPFFQ